MVKQKTSKAFKVRRYIMAKMNEDQQKELIEAVTTAAQDPNTRVFLSMTLNGNGNLQRRGFMSNANPLEVISFLGELLEATTNMAEQADGPFKGFIPHLNEMKRLTDMGNLMQMMLNAKNEESEEEPAEDDDKPFDFNFEIPGGK
jgi:hypothetical protein